jgi:hypothetical protein
MTHAELDAGTQAVRKVADSSGYGGYVSDDWCRRVAAAVIIEVLPFTITTPVPKPAAAT